MALVSIVAPFFNEEDTVATFFERLDRVIGHERDCCSFEVVAVNDGSTDGTLERLLLAQKRYSYLAIIDLARNFGKEAAVTAGLDHARGDAVIPMDTDLQHPPEVIPDLIAKWREGYEVVLARRSSRITDSKLQRLTSRWFYGLMKNIGNSPIPPDVGDFRLIDRLVADAMLQMRETHRFMKGLFAWVGFRTGTIIFDVEPRYAGKPSFNLWRRWNFALDGITSFSTAPIRVWFYIGTIIAALSIFYGIYETLRTLLYGIDVPGYASLIVILLFSCGIQLIGLGLIGEYVGRIFIESKRRPIYIIKRSYQGGRTSGVHSAHIAAQVH